MNNGIQTIIYPVSNLAESKQLFSTLLGVQPYMDEPYYVGFSVAGQDIGLDPHAAHKGITSPLSYYHVSDIQQSLQALVDGGAQVVQDVKNVGGGKLIAAVKEASGNVIGLLQMPG